MFFFRYENEQLNKIRVGVSGAGGGDIHDKFYEENKWILTRKKCEHASKMLENNNPLFLCEDGKIRCNECFYNEKLNIADPILKVNSEKFMWLIPVTYNPYNIEFNFECDKEGIKGQYINSNIIIKNHKKSSITNLCINVESYAKDINNYWMESDESQYLLLTKIHADMLDSGKEIHIPLKIYIPQYDEVKEYDFVDLNEYYEFPTEINKLKVPNNLKIFVNFSYTSASGFDYWSYTKETIVKLE